MSKNFVSKDNIGENIWQKLDKSRKIRQEQKSLPSVFALIRTTIAKKLFLERKLATRLCLIFPNFLRS